MPSLPMFNFLKDNYGIILNELICLPTGADQHATVYKGVSDQRNYFIKAKRHYDHEMSLAIIKLFDVVGIRQVIQPIKTLDGKLTSILDDRTIIVYPFIEGQDGFHCELTAEQWILLGKTLRRIHDLSIPDIIRGKIRKETFSTDCIRFVDELLKQIEGSQSNELLRVVNDKKSLIKKLIEQTERLIKQVREAKEEWVLCHADIHGGNVLIHHQDIYIVDWDDPMLAPKERDLMFIGGGVGNVWNHPEGMKYFFEGYGPVTIDPLLLSYYRSQRILVDIVEFVQEYQSVQDENIKKRINDLFLSMFNPGGVVEIALKPIT